MKKNTHNSQAKQLPVLFTICCRAISDMYAGLQLLLCGLFFFASLLVLFTFRRYSNLYHIVPYLLSILSYSSK